MGLGESTEHPKGSGILPITGCNMLLNSSKRDVTLLVAPENRPPQGLPTRKVVFQPSIFRGYVSC